MIVTEKISERILEGMKSLSNLTQRNAQAYMQQLSRATGFENLKPPSGLGECHYHETALDPDRFASNPDKRMDMHRESFETMRDIDGGKPTRGSGGKLTQDQDPKPNQVLYSETGLNRFAGFEASSTTMATLQGSNTNGQLNTATTYRNEEDGSIVEQEYRLTRLKNGGSQELSMVVNDEGAYIRIDDVRKGPGVDFSIGTHRQWRLDPEQLAHSAGNLNNPGTLTVLDDEKSPYIRVLSEYFTR